MPQNKDIEYLALANKRKDALGIADDSDDLMLFLQLALILIFFRLSHLRNCMFCLHLQQNQTLYGYLLFVLGATRSHIADNIREIKKCQKGH